MSKKKRLQFTKILILIILFNSLIGLDICIFMSVESIGVALATEIIGVFSVYCCKSFFETKEEKKNELITKLSEMPTEAEWEAMNHED